VITRSIHAKSPPATTIPRAAQRTKLGKGEHVLDYFIEMSWWMALAHHFQVSG